MPREMTCSTKLPLNKSNSFMAISFMAVPEKDTELTYSLDQFPSIKSSYACTQKQDACFVIRLHLLFVDLEFTMEFYKVYEKRNKRKGRVNLILCVSLSHASRRSLQGCAPCRSVPWLQIVSTAPSSGFFLAGKHRRKPAPQNSTPQGWSVQQHGHILGMLALPSALPSFCHFSSANNYGHNALE